MYKKDLSKQKNLTDYSIQLVVFLDEEEQIKETFELNIGINVIGRNPKDCTAIINKPEIEKKHLQFEIEYDNLTNKITASIQSLKSESGVQKRQKDGNLQNFNQNKWTQIGDLSKEFVFYIAKKYKCIVRKVPQNSKLNKSLEGYSTQKKESQSYNQSKISFLQSLENMDRKELSDKKKKDENQFETLSDNVKNYSENSNNEQQDQNSKSKMFGKNFKSKNLSSESSNNLHTKFKSPSVTQGSKTSKLDIVVNKECKKNLEVEESISDISIQTSITLQVPSRSTIISSKSKDFDSKQLDKDEKQKDSKQKYNEKKSKIKKNTSNQPKEQSLDVSIDLKDNDKKKPNMNTKSLTSKENKENLKTMSTDDEVTDKKQENKINDKDKMIDESEELSKKKQKEGQAKKINNKRKIQEILNDSKHMDIEEEIRKNQEIKQEMNETKNQTKEGKPKKIVKLTSNSPGQQKKNKQVEENKDKQIEFEMIDEEKIKDDKKQTFNKSITTPYKIIEEKNLIDDKGSNKQNFKQKQPSQKLKEDVQKDTQNHQVQKEINQKEGNEGQKKLEKASKMDQKKQVKKNQQKKIAEQKNSIIKNSLEYDNSENEELSHSVNSDEEEEYVQKSHTSSKKSISKQSVSNYQSASKQVKKFNVIFSNCDFDQTDISDRLSKLGARIMKNLQQPFNILVMDKFTRRAKTLVALNKGAKIISSQWVLDCICQERLIEDIEKYEIKVDKDFSKKYKFDLLEVQKRNINQDKPIFLDIKFILPEEETYQNIVKGDLEYIIMTAGGSVISEDECDNIQDKQNIKVIFDNDQTDNFHTSPDKQTQKINLSNKKKKAQSENRQKLQQAYKQNSYDCILIEAIFQSCLQQKVCNWSQFTI